MQMTMPEGGPQPYGGSDRRRGALAKDRRPMVKSAVMLYYLFATLYVLSCMLLLLVVLLQQGKGGDIASAFGGGGSQTAFGARAGATVLTKATAILGVLFMVGAIALGIVGRGGTGSLMRGLGAPAPVSAPATQPQTPAAPVAAPATPAATQPGPEKPAEGTAKPAPDTTKPSGPPK